MYYGGQRFPDIKAMSEWERQFAYHAVWAVIRAEQRAAENAQEKAERDRALAAKE